MRRILAFALLTLPTFAQEPIRGFSPTEWKTQHEREQKLRATPQPEKLRDYMRQMTEEPHHAGSPGSMAVAEYALGLLRQWGLDARIEAYEALLPYPTVRSLDLIAPVKFKAKLKESVIREDKDSADADQLPTYNAYSGSGEVTGQLVYVNYGTPEDYEVLKKLGISVKGKVVIARYGKCWRGTKAKVAQEHGAVACLIYSDPRDDGYFGGDVYPKGPFRPSQGVQRGSVMDMPVSVGDPLSPGWASERGAKKLTREEAKSIMKILVQPISYEDAAPLLENMDGPVAPENWRGALPITYHLGPGTSTVRLKLEFDWAVRPLYNVIATIPGSSYPNQWVIYGNHHDAWVNGAQDPVSGAVALLETARAFAELKKEGWRPKRTIKFALWDGEEFGLLGSTEWVEKHRAELDRKAVAYLNSDSTGRGRLSAGGSPALQRFMEQVARDVTDPVTSKSVLEENLKGAGRQGSERPPEFNLYPLGAGSDYVAFIHHVGIASLNAGFAGDDPGGIYHSIYDSFNWYTKFSDGNFVYGKAFAQLMGTAMLRLADAPILPFEFGGFVTDVRRWNGDLDKLGKKSGKLDVSPISAELERLEAAAAKYEAALDLALKSPAVIPVAEMAQLNEILYRSERALLTPGGLPGRDWYKYQIFAPGLYTGYSAKTLPAIREAAEAARWDEANAQVKVIVQVLQALNQQVEAATKMLAR